MSNQKGPNIKKKQKCKNCEGKGLLKKGDKVVKCQRCGGTGFRVSVEQNAPDEGHRFVASGIPVVMDDYAFHKLSGAILEVDEDPAGEGYRLNHPDAVMTTFC